MRINTNVSANSALLNLSRVQDEVSKSMEKLSSGFRINHASDDAAGLGIANTLRANTRSLTQASANAEQAGAMLNIAEGGADAVQSILERMKELAAQSASSNSGDRNQIQSEFSTLRTELDRIVNTTQYQGQNLIDGSLGNSITAGGITTNTSLQSSTIKITGTKAGTYTLAKVDATHLSLTDGNGNVQQVAVTSSTGVQTVNFGNFGVSFQTGGTFDISGSNNTVSSNNVLTVAAGAHAADFLVSTAAGAYTGNDLVSIASAISLGSTAIGIGSSTVATQAGAQSTLSDLDTAISNVSSALGTIGATQSRLSFALDNTKSAIQNQTAAESTIRDVDMASEMTSFSKNQILAQAGTAMLAQANQLGAGVLKLLQ